MAVTEHCDYVIWSLLSALNSGPVAYVSLFKSATSFAESGVLFLSLQGVLAFVPDGRSFPVFRNNQLILKNGYLAYHRSREVGCRDEA